MISAGFGTLAFLNPWVLAGIVFLPALWFLLRITPPVPRLVRFPAARFLAGLQADDHTPRHTPLWILLLRLLTAALIILALARPILNPGVLLPGTGPVRIVIDNGWAAAQTWERQIAAAQDIAARAGRAKREIYILATAPESGNAPLRQQGPLPAGPAADILAGLNPLPWPATYDEAATAAEQSTFESDITSFWLSDGLKEGDPARLAKTLRAHGPLQIYRPDPHELPLLLRPSKGTGGAPRVLVDFPPELPVKTPVTIQVFGTDGKILDTQHKVIGRTDKPLAVDIELPAPLRQQIGQIRLAGRRGAGGVILFDDRYKRRAVGIATAGEREDSSPLIESVFYIERALEPTSDIIRGTVGALLNKKPSVIILPDIGALPPDEINALEKWVREGGLLLRFAGPHMTQGESFLTPVPLRKGGRALEGALTWEKPEHMAPFAESSPYFGLNIPAEITINRQILAEPVEGIEKMSWAALQDGTPLITAAPLDHGLLVLVHTTATPEWSDLALSGLFVQILQRTVNMAGQAATATAVNGSLQPLSVLDGMGSPAPPGGFVQPISADKFDETAPSPRHPPGLYGRAGSQQALNLGARLPPLQSFAVEQADAGPRTYGGARETELMPQFLAGAFLLFLLDWLIMLALQAGFRGLGRRAAPAALALLLLAGTATGVSAATPDEMVKHAGDLYLAYIRSGIPDVDGIAQAGLTGLAEVLTQRTSVEPAGVVAVSPEIDDLSFFPFIYWPVPPDQPPLSLTALRNVQFYLDHGGTILFDTRDRQSATATSGGRNADSLRRLIGGLDVPPLTPIPKGHVLTKSFYLLKSFPGRYNGGTLWVEENSARGRDGVSSIIIGSNDWASAWAAESGRSTLILENGPEQQEMAARFGINMVMYALTGNYKNDQVHLPHILERLGE